MSDWRSREGLRVCRTLSLSLRFTRIPGRSKSYGELFLISEGHVVCTDVKTWIDHSVYIVWKMVTVSSTMWVGVRCSKKRVCPWYDTKLHLMVSIPSLLLLPDSLWPGVVVVVVLVKVLSIGQIDLFENSLYLVRLYTTPRSI